MNRNPVCKACGKHSIRLDAYDAYACKRCDHWVSKPCTDVPGKCDYCDRLRKLPRPSDAPPAAWNDPNNT